jgi:hypothetical protein
MRSTLVIPTLVVGISVAAALSTPAAAQYGPTYGPHYYGPGAYTPGYGPRPFRGGYGAYYEGPMIEPFFSGDGWVPESIYQHSRPGGIDPNIRPSGS